MQAQEIDRKMDELERLLNDPDVKLEPSRVWMLLADVAQHDLARYAKAM